MNDVMKILYAVDAECQDKQPEKIDKNIDEFTMTKRRMADGFRELHKLIKKRDGLNSMKTEERYQMVMLTTQIRNNLTHMEAQAKRMRSLQRLQARKGKSTRKKKKTTIADNIMHRAQVVDLMFRHVEEIERLERLHVEDINAPSMTDFFTGDVSVTNMANDGFKDLTGFDVAKTLAGDNKKSGAEALAAAPEVEIDPALMEIQATREGFDEDIAQIKDGVGMLRDIAVDMGEELKVQSAHMDEVEKTVDEGLSHLNTLNDKLGETLNDAKSSKACLCNLLLLLIVLSLAYYIYTLLTTPPAADAEAEEGEEAAAAEGS